MENLGKVGEAPVNEDVGICWRLLRRRDQTKGALQTRQQSRLVRPA